MDEGFRDLDTQVLDPPADGKRNGAPKSDSLPSALDRVRRRRDGFQRERHVDLDIPGYRGDLVARYRPLTYDEVLAINERIATATAQEDSRATLYGQIATLTAACTGIFVRGDGGLEPLDPDGSPTVYEPKLGRLLDFEPADSPALALQGTFPNELDIVGHHMEFVAWSDRASDDVDKDTLGE